MIESYSDHAANERTFLAWVRTGLATVAFGFVIEKFDLIVRHLSEASQIAKQSDAILTRTSTPLGRYDGGALVLVGIALIALAAYRFVRTGRLIASVERHSMGSVRAELALSLSLIAAALAAYLVLD